MAFVSQSEILLNLALSNKEFYASAIPILYDTLDFIGSFVYPLKDYDVHDARITLRSRLFLQSYGAQQHARAYTRRLTFVVSACELDGIQPPHSLAQTLLACRDIRLIQLACNESLDRDDCNFRFGEQMFRPLKKLRVVQLDDFDILAGKLEDWTLTFMTMPTVQRLALRALHTAIAIDNISRQSWTKALAESHLGELCVQRSYAINSTDITLFRALEAMPSYCSLRILKMPLDVNAAPIRFESLQCRYNIEHLSIYLTYNAGLLENDIGVHMDLAGWTRLKTLHILRGVFPWVARGLKTWRPPSNCEVHVQSPSALFLRDLLVRLASGYFESQYLLQVSVDTSFSTMSMGMPGKWSFEHASDLLQYLKWLDTVWTTSYGTEALQKLILLRHVSWSSMMKVASIETAEIFTLIVKRMNTLSAELQAPAQDTNLNAQTEDNASDAIDAVISELAAYTMQMVPS